MDSLGFLIATAAFIWYGIKFLFQACFFVFELSYVVIMIVWNILHDFITGEDR